MKKFIIALMALGIVSCSACAKKDQTPDAAPPVPTASTPDASPPPVTTVTITTGHATLTLPSTDWKKLETDGTVYGYINMTLKNAVVLGQEEFTGSRDAYILQALRSVKDSGGTVNSTKQVTLNGHNFALFEVTKNGNTLWAWTTVESGFGIILTCGGAPSTPQGDLCQGIASTLKLN